MKLIWTVVISAILAIIAAGGFSLAGKGSDISPWTVFVVCFIVFMFLSKKAKKKIVIFLVIAAPVLAIGGWLIVQGEMGDQGVFRIFNGASGNIRSFLHNIPWWVYLGGLFGFCCLVCYLGATCPKCKKRGALVEDRDNKVIISRSPRPYWSKARNCLVYKVVYRIPVHCSYCDYETTEDVTEEVPEDNFTE